ncbi:hypothetical protein, conserved [Eimeria brunetti]|uniref:Uncharacterized protein n=1 Tax=Eimeria brunetti TaxID=51314 RepID=U6LKR8_9EIME|nr:hypothetical protein, conserved [Eimeria brunetti]
MGKFKILVPCLCWRKLGSVTEPNRRQATSAGRCDQVSEGKCVEKPPPQEPVHKLEESVACGTGRSIPDFVPHERQSATKLGAKEGHNNATSAVLETAEDGNRDLALPFAAPADEKERMPETELLESDNNFIHSNISVLEEKLKYDEDGRNTSQETIPGNESRVTSSPISLMCPTSTGGGEEDHRTVVSIPSLRGGQGSQNDEKEGLNGTSITHGLQGGMDFSLTRQTVEMGMEPSGKGDHRAIVSTLAIPEAQGSRKGETEVVGATNIVREEQKAGTDCSSTTKHMEDKGKTSTEVLQADDINQSVEDGKELKAKSSKKKRKSRRNRGNRSQSEAKTGQTAGTETDVPVAGDSIVADGDSLEDGLRNKGPAGESLVPQNPLRQTEDAKPVRRHKKKKSKVKGKRRHGRTGRR